MDPIEQGQPQQKSNGALIGSIIIIIILIIGGIYFWQSSLKEKIDEPENSNVGDATSPVSDNTADLEASIGSIDLESLDSEI
jgi:flagellar basal body-associated protein FliL